MSPTSLEQAVRPPDSTGPAAPPRSLRPPGTAIHYVPASSRTYVGSPALAILPDGAYAAAHGLFGSTTSTAARTAPTTQTTSPSTASPIFAASIPPDRPSGRHLAASRRPFRRPLP